MSQAQELKHVKSFDVARPAFLFASRKSLNAQKFSEK